MKFDRTRQLLTIFAVSIAAGSTFISCAPAPEPSPAVPAPVISIGPTAQVPTNQVLGAHWIHNRALKEVMAELLTHNPSWPNAMPQDPESKKVGSVEDFDKIASLANTLMLSADELPAVAEKLTMIEADRSGFLAEAKVLHDQAQRLVDAARMHHVEQMQLHMSSINSTCISCHSRYRDFSGQLDSTLAANPIGAPQQQGAP